MYYSVKNVYRKREKVCQKYNTKRKKSRRLWKMCVEACPIILYNRKIGISTGICDGEKIGWLQ